MRNTSRSAALKHLTMCAFKELRDSSGTLDPVVSKLEESLREAQHVARKIHDLRMRQFELGQAKKGPG